MHLHALRLKESIETGDVRPSWVTLTAPERMPIPVALQSSFALPPRHSISVGWRKPDVTVDKLLRAQEHISNGLNVREAAARLKVSKTALYAALQSSHVTKIPKGCSTYEDAE